MKIAVIGSGFWARYRVAGWQVLPGVRIAGLYNRTRPKADALTREFRVPAVYESAAANRVVPLDHAIGAGA